MICSSRTRSAEPGVDGRLGHAASCPFCERISGEVDLQLTSDAAVAFADSSPVAAGHTLVVPRRHVPTPFELSQREWDDLFRLVRAVHDRLAEERSPDGVNIGINSGAPAGQTVPHAHVHVIPRSHGDARDPRGGVRWVVPERAAYWEGT